MERLIKGAFLKRITKLVLFNAPECSYKFLSEDRVFLQKYNFVVKSQPEYKIHTQHLYFEEDNQSIALVRIEVCSPKVMVYCHGNSSDIGSSIVWLTKLASMLHTSIITYDPRGFGLSSKASINEHTTYRDLQMVVIHAQTLGYALNQITLWGFSMGTGAAVEIARQFQFLHSLILEAPLASTYYRIHLSETQSDEGCNIYNSYEKIADIRSPILIMHGTKDRVIPHHHSQLLYNKCIDKRCASLGSVDLLLVEGIGHNDFKPLLILEQS